MTFLGVLVGIDHHQVLGLPECQSGRHPVLSERVTLISLEVGWIGKPDRDCVFRNLKIGQREMRVGQKLVGQHDNGHLIPIGQCERTKGDMKGILRIRRRQDGAREFSMSTSNGERQVFLGRTRRQAGSRSRPLCQYDDQGRLCHSCQADGFRHQGEAAA